MGPMGITERLAQVSAGRPWLVVTAWVVLVVIGGFFATGIGDVLTGNFSQSNEPESHRANQLLEERLRGPDQAEEFVLVVSEVATVDDPPFEAKVSQLPLETSGLPFRRQPRRAETGPRA